MSIESKIQKIMAKATSTNSEAEAESLMAKVQSMLAEHNLTLEQVDATVRATMDPMGRKNFDNSKHSWENRLFGSVAKYYGASAVIDNGHWTGKKGRPTAMGRESSLATLEVMWPFILAEVKRAAKAVAKSDSMSSGAAQRRTAEAMRYRLYSLTVRDEKAAEVAGGGMSLVLKDEVSNEVAKHFPNLSNSRKSQTGSTSSARDAVSKISLNLQAGGNAVRRIS